jgi:sarcosine oxidase, subunit gamma
MQKPFFVGQRSLKILQSRGAAAVAGRHRDRTASARCRRNVIWSSTRATSRAESPASRARATLNKSSDSRCCRRSSPSPAANIKIRVDGGAMAHARVVPTPFYDPKNLRQKAAGRHERRARSNGARGATDWASKGRRRREWLGAGAWQCRRRPIPWIEAEGAGRKTCWSRGSGTSEFFSRRQPVRRSRKDYRALSPRSRPARFPVLREDWGFDLAGEDVHAVLAQVCNVNFAALAPTSSPVIMTMMVGVAVLVVPQAAGQGRCCYRIWCDPTFGPYLGESLGAVVVEMRGNFTGVSA